MASELCQEGELVQIPDDAGAIPGAAHNDVIRQRRRQARDSVSVTQQSLQSTVRGRRGNQETAQKFHIKPSYLKDSDNITRISYQKMQPPCKSSVDNYFHN